MRIRGKMLLTTSKVALIGRREVPSFSVSCHNFDANRVENFGVNRCTATFTASPISPTVLVISSPPREKTP